MVYFIIEKEGCQTISSSRVVTISKATPTLTIADKDVAYDGNPQGVLAATVSGVKSDDVPTGSVTYKYYTDKECTIPTDLENSGASSINGEPVKEGTYYVKAAIAEDDNYTANESNVACIEINKYTVSFDLQGHRKDEISNIVGVIAGNKISEPTSPVDDDYIFIGWYKDKEFVNEWQLEADVVAKDTVLYAKWKSKKI